MLMLLGVLGFVGALFLVILDAAHSRGLTLKQWLDICEKKKKIEGEELKRRYLQQ